MYLKQLHIENFRGIKNLTVTFNKQLNVLIGPNGSHKTAVIDAIRLFYSWGNQNKDIEITEDDFYREMIFDGDHYTQKRSESFSITYIFDDLTEEQQGALYAYLTLINGHLFAQVKITYQITANRKILASYVTGNIDTNQRADSHTFDLFSSYYLGALRDSTRDLMSIRNNILGRVIGRKIERAHSDEDFKVIVRETNSQLLRRDEVITTQKNINDNLHSIYYGDTQQIGLKIEEHDRVNGIINVIRPFIKTDKASGLDSLPLHCNSMGANNIIYIATVLGDMNETRDAERLQICTLLIEEPEAHLHPQLQVNLYEFLKSNDCGNMNQVFITTHSPSLTSKIPLENILLMSDQRIIRISSCFENRDQEGLVYNAQNHEIVDNNRCVFYQNMLVRYLDVTRSQLFFSRSCCFVEGISEVLLINTFSKILNKSFSKNQVEVVNVDGTGFGQFIMLYNSNDGAKRLPQKVAFITDEDQYVESKETQFGSVTKLVANNYAKLQELRIGIQSGNVVSRVNNMKALANNQKNILIASGYKTLEYQICFANVSNITTDIRGNSLYNFFQLNYPADMCMIEDYLQSIERDVLCDEDMENVALLMWKCIDHKTEFAQRLVAFIEERLSANNLVFNVPQYLQEAIGHLVP